MAYNAQNAKPVYYKQQVTTFTQLQKNILRMQYDTRMCGSTKAQYIENMFAQYKAHCNVK